MSLRYSSTITPRAARLRRAFVQCRDCSSQVHEDDQVALAAAAADAEVDISVFSAESWPDGTPKKFRGREAWKNWIDFKTENRHCQFNPQI